MKDKITWQIDPGSPPIEIEYDPAYRLSIGVALAPFLTVPATDYPELQDALDTFVALEADLELLEQDPLNQNLRDQVNANFAHLEQMPLLSWDDRLLRAKAVLNFITF